MEEKIKSIKTIDQIELKGDIVITDPCYLDHYMEHEEAWFDFINKDKIPSLMQTRTLYGDWGCTLYKIDKKNKKIPIGHFTADAGMVCVCTLKDVLKFNPNFNDFIEKCSRCAAIVKGFKGKIMFQKAKAEYKYEGKKYCDDFIFVEGCGEKYGRPYNFVSNQTSL